MKTFEEWIKEREPQYYEDLTYCERDFYKTRYALEQKIEVLEGRLERILSCQHKNITINPLYASDGEVFLECKDCGLQFSGEMIERLRKATTV